MLRYTAALTRTDNGPYRSDQSWSNVNPIFYFLVRERHRSGYGWSFYCNIRRCLLELPMPQQLHLDWKRWCYRMQGYRMHNGPLLREER